MIAIQDRCRGCPPGARWGPPWRGHPVMLESLPGFAARQHGLLAQPADAPLPPVLRLLLQQCLQGVAVADGGEAGHRFCTHGMQTELMAQFSDPVLNRHGVRH